MAVDPTVWETAAGRLDGFTGWGDDWRDGWQNLFNLHAALGTFNVRYYGAAGDGVTDDRAAIQAAIDAAVAAGGGIVLFPPGHYRINSTTTNGSGETCGLSIVGSRVYLLGSGQGSGRSGNANSNAVSIISSSVAMSRLISFDSANNSPTAGSPDWRGGGIRKLHLSNRTAGDTGSSGTGAANIDSGVDVRGLNNFWILECSFSHFRAAAGKAVLLRNARGGSTDGEPTQYGRMMFCDVWNCWAGVYAQKTGTSSRPPIPDWQFDYNQMQTVTSNPPLAGSRGLYINSNAVRIFNNEIQFWDVGIEVDCATNGLGRHITIKENHFEADTGTTDDAYEAMIKITNPAAAEQQCILIVDNESANVAKYQDVINIGGTNVQETRIRNHRIRDTAWITSANQATYVTLNGATIDVA